MQKLKQIGIFENRNEMLQPLLKITEEKPNW